MKKKYEENIDLLADNHHVHQAHESILPKQETSLGSLVKNTVFSKVTAEELEVIEILEKARPHSLRSFDQIPMRGADLLCQVKIAAQKLANKDVVFIGDHDGTSLLIGLLSSKGLIPAPSRMTILDFDERLLCRARFLAKEYGFQDVLEVRPYNVFHTIPKDLNGMFDIFYTNPPYGKSNLGQSARLFIARGFELTHSNPNAVGYMILPVDSEREWTRKSMYLTQQFLINHGWRILEHIPKVHRYHLETDRNLMSSILTATIENMTAIKPSWFGKAIPQEEIPHFYGKKVPLPYPHFITEDGQKIIDIDEIN